MVLSSKAIRKAIDQGELKIDPFEEGQIEAAHINLHLDCPNGRKTLAIGPREFVLARTVETVTLPQNLCGLLDGRASLARQGISVAQSSTFVEPGTNNPMTLELFNANGEAVVLEQGQEIAKLILMPVVDEV